MGKIYDLLPTGQKNAISKADLCRITDLSQRQLRREIAVERKRGLLIASSVEPQEGIYRPATEAEAQAFISSMRRRAREILSVAKATERTLARQASAEAFAGLEDSAKVRESEAKHGGTSDVQ